MATPILDWLRDAPLWQAGAALLVTQLAARELGAAIRRYRLARQPDDEESDKEQTGYVVSSILGLLALLIGFTFSLALNRFETRQTIVNQEAQALATVNERLLLYRDGTRLVPFLEAHARIRWREVIGEAVPAAGKTAKQRDALWREAIAVVKAEDSPPMVPFLLGPLGEAFDTADEQRLQQARRIDGGVLSMLVVLALASALTVGLTAPKGRHRWISAMLFTLLTMSLLSILDLDQANAGRSQLSDAAWRQALSGMATTALPPR
jgi:hypothetical protein